MVSDFQLPRPVSGYQPPDRAEETGKEFEDGWPRRIRRRGPSRYVAVLYVRSGGKPVGRPGGLGLFRERFADARRLWPSSKRHHCE